MRLNPEDLLLLVIDVQERLFGQIANNQPLHVKLPKLIQGFKLFNIPIILNEQYKKGLGNSIKEKIGRAHV